MPSQTLLHKAMIMRAFAGGCRTVDVASARFTGLQPFKGQVHLLSVALNYSGSDAELNCTPDCERLSSIAAARGVKDIVKIYDDGTTDRHPSMAEVTEAIQEMGARCEPGDYFVFQYSGHGSNKENEDEESGFDSILCLTTRDGEDEEWLDDDISDCILAAFHPEVNILVLCDACHSAGCLDFTKKFKGRSVCALSGCQDTQCSTDTGDGGAMTNALLSVLKTRSTKKLRKTRKASIQFIFNRMVEKMEEAQEEDEEEDDEEWESEDEYESESEDEDDVDPITGEEPEEGQTINLMWIGRDPISRAFPF